MNEPSDSKGAPRQSSPEDLVDRESELQVIESMMTRSGVRLLTLVGPAGAGKTRLAIESGERISHLYPHGVFFVDVALVTDPDLVLPMLAREVGLQNTAPNTLLDAMTTFMENRTVLVILDNFEQVLPAGRALVDVLSRCPGLTFLVTSRSSLELEHERVVVVRPLAVPDLDRLPPPEELALIPSVALFLQRARARSPGFQLTEENSRAVAKLCIRFDGLPLAIELGTARLDILPLDVISNLLDDRPRLLSWYAADIPRRHQSMQAAIDWSYDLLTENSKATFRRLGVFAGNASLSAVDFVTGNLDPERTLDEMTTLAMSSLVLPAAQYDNEPCFETLQTVREYARELLDEAGDRQKVRDLHAQYFLELAETADRRLRQSDQLAWFLRLEQEHDNLRHALDWLLERDATDSAARLAGAMAYFWWRRGYGGEGSQWLARSLTSGGTVSPEVRAKALIGAGRLMIYACELDKGRVALDEALALARRQDDEALVAESLAHLGLAASFAGQHDEGELLLSEALALTRQLGPEPHTSLLVMVFSEMAIAELRRSDYQAALLHLDDALANFVTVGDQRGGAAARILQAHTLRRMGDVNGAVTMLREAIIEGLRFLDPILLGAGAGITFLLSTDCVEPPPRTRLLGAAEALSERAGAGIILEKLAGETLDRFHVEVEQAEMLKEYRRGRLLSLEEAATAALACLDDIDRPAEREREATSGGRSALTQTEQRVLGLVAAGIPDKQIARELGIAERTVRRHVSSILRTLEASSRSHAVAMAMQRGML